MPDPLILTARFDPEAAAVLQRLRDRWFPAASNIVPAHLTLFHHLPGTELETVLASLEETRPASAVPFRTGGLRFLGRGVAVEVAAEGLAAARSRLAARWSTRLTAQDRQPFRPHVTLMNKSTPAAARDALERLRSEGIDLAGVIEGLDLWHYRGGPWQAAGGVRWGTAAGGSPA